MRRSSGTTCRPWRKRGPREQAIGRLRAGFTCKVHCVGDALGTPLSFYPTGGEAANCHSCDALMALPVHTPGELLAGKGYTSDAIRDDIVARSVRPGDPGSAKPLEIDPLQQADRPLT